MAFCNCKITSGRAHLPILFAGLVVMTSLALRAPAFAANPPPTPSSAAPPAPTDGDTTEAQLPRWRTELLSGDEARVAAVAAEMDKFHANYNGQWLIFKLFHETKQYTQFETRAMQRLCTLHDDGKRKGDIEKMRVNAFLAQGKNEEALSAARSYFDICPLAETTDAIDLIARSLTAARPNDKDIAARFRKQQLAGAAIEPASPSTQPAVELGSPILASIKVDPAPFDLDIQFLTASDYPSSVAKANLLILAGRYAEARDLFEAALKIAADKELVDAVENVARAIRAQSGCIGPVNAYILGERNVK